MREIAHGTYPGWNAEQRAGIPHCDDCRHAAAVYHREWRSKSPKAKNWKERDKADSRALRKLARLHPAQYRALREEEYRKAGLT